MLQSIGTINIDYGIKKLGIVRIRPITRRKYCNTSNSLTIHPGNPPRGLADLLPKGVSGFKKEADLKAQEAKKKLNEVKNAIKLKDVNTVLKLVMEAAEVHKSVVTTVSFFSSICEEKDSEVLSQIIQEHFIALMDFYTLPLIKKSIDFISQNDESLSVEAQNFSNFLARDFERFSKSHINQQAEESSDKLARLEADLEALEEVKEVKIPIWAVNTSTAPLPPEYITQGPQFYSYDIGKPEITNHLLTYHPDEAVRRAVWFQASKFHRPLDSLTAPPVDQDEYIIHPELVDNLTQTFLNRYEYSEAHKTGKTFFQLENWNHGISAPQEFFGDFKNAIQNKTEQQVNHLKRAKRNMSQTSKNPLNSNRSSFAASSPSPIDIYPWDIAYCSRLCKYDMILTDFINNGPSAAPDSEKFRSATHFIDSQLAEYFKLAEMFRALKDIWRMMDVDMRIVQPDPKETWEAQIIKLEFFDASNKKMAECYLDLASIDSNITIIQRKTSEQYAKLCLNINVANYGSVMIEQPKPMNEWLSIIPKQILAHTVFNTPILVPFDVIRRLFGLFGQMSRYILEDNQYRTFQNDLKCAELESLPELIFDRLATHYPFISQYTQHHFEKHGLDEYNFDQWKDVDGVAAGIDYSLELTAEAIHFNLNSTPSRENLVTRLDQYYQKYLPLIKVVSGSYTHQLERLSEKNGTNSLFTDFLAFEVYFKLFGADPLSKQSFQHLRHSIIAPLAMLNTEQLRSGVGLEKTPNWTNFTEKFNKPYFTL